MATDLSGAIYDWLLEADAAEDYRDLVVSENIKEAGFIDIELLNSAQTTRRSAASSQILATSVQDNGDAPFAVSNEHATVTIRHYDRGYGYKHLRLARDMLREVLREFSTTLDAVAGRRRGVLTLDYAGRTGHRRDTVTNCDWEALTFIGTLLVEE